MFVQGETNPEVEVLINGQKIMTNERVCLKKK